MPRRGRLRYGVYPHHGYGRGPPAEGESKTGSGSDLSKRLEGNRPKKSASIQKGVRNDFEGCVLILRPRVDPRGVWCVQAAIRRNSDAGDSELRLSIADTRVDKPTRYHNDVLRPKTPVSAGGDHAVRSLA